MLEKVRDTLTQFNMISSGEIVVVGVSGGADSVALLYNLCEYRKLVPFEIKVVHVNHLIREDASYDASFVCELCKQHDVEYHLFEIDVEKMAKDEHLSTEEAGRIARYNAMRSLNADKIAVGHHLDDQTETVLLNVCRGTGLHGIRGIAPVQNDIIRPLLFVSRAEIEQYLNSINQSYHTDSTNLTLDYVRNRLRHKVIPYLNSEINEKSDLHIAQLATDMLELEQYINENIEGLYLELCKPDKQQCEISTGISDLLSLNTFICRELILRILEELTPKRKDITRNHVNQIIDLCYVNGSKSIDLPYELQAVKVYDNLIIRKRRNRSEKILHIDIAEELLEKGTDIRADENISLKMRVFDKPNDFIIEDNKYTKYFDYDKIKCSLVVRTRHPGDYLIISDKGQKKNLKDYMINEKIPKEEREDILLVADGEQIMWVVGYRIGATYKISEQTHRVLEIMVEYNE
ncbi:MAG: tRNA lysidine(34) synthetase TilS [Lachnospiraceae bacterium]|nr:tRNA lysidine(34) synthetase TilS [Candidatus Colinaster scatohippi]